MPYLIYPSDNSGLEVDPDDLSRLLRKQWPMVIFRQKIPKETVLLEWEIKAGNINHVGTLHSNRRTLAIDDYPLGVSELALWYRQIIPEKYDIFLCHDSDANLEVKITTQTNASEILKQLESDV